MRTGTPLRAAPLLACTNQRGHVSLRKIDSEATGEVACALPVVGTGVDPVTFPDGLSRRCVARFRTVRSPDATSGGQRRMSAGPCAAARRFEDGDSTEVDALDVSLGNDVRKPEHPERVGQTEQGRECGDEQRDLERAGSGRGC